MFHRVQILSLVTQKGQYLAQKRYQDSCFLYHHHGYTGDWRHRGLSSLGGLTTESFQKDENRETLLVFVRNVAQNFFDSEQALLLKYRQKSLAILGQQDLSQ
jgi:hypothetical protein